MCEFGGISGIKLHQNDPQMSTISSIFLHIFGNNWASFREFDPRLKPQINSPKNGHFVGKSTLKRPNHKLSRRAKSGRKVSKSTHFHPLHFHSHIPKISTPPTGFAGLLRGDLQRSVSDNATRAAYSMSRSDTYVTRSFTCSFFTSSVAPSIRVATLHTIASQLGSSQLRWAPPGLLNVGRQATSTPREASPPGRASPSLLDAQLLVPRSLC